MKKMKQTILKFCLFFTIFILTSCIQNRNIHYVENLGIVWNQLEHLDENSLVIFDVDDTLITPIDNFFHIKSTIKRILLWTYYAIKTKDFILTVRYREDGIVFCPSFIVHPMSREEDFPKDMETVVLNEPGLRPRVIERR